MAPPRCCSCGSRKGEDASPRCFLGAQSSLFSLLTSESAPLTGPKFFPCSCTTQTKSIWDSKAVSAGSIPQLLNMCSPSVIPQLRNRRDSITAHLLKKRAGSRLFFPPVFLQQILIYRQGRWSFESSQRKVVCQEMKSCGGGNIL